MATSKISFSSLSFTTWSREAECFIYAKNVNLNIGLNPSSPNPGQREKIKWIIYFYTSSCCLERFYKTIKALKAFIKPFVAPQASEKKINLIFTSIQLSEMHGSRVSLLKMLEIFSKYLPSTYQLSTLNIFFVYWYWTALLGFQRHKTSAVLYSILSSLKLWKTP